MGADEAGEVGRKAALRCLTNKVNFLELHQEGTGLRGCKGMKAGSPLDVKSWGGGTANDSSELATGRTAGRRLQQSKQSKRERKSKDQ